MEIANNILKHYLKNCYFISGTAFSGKSTMCQMLAEKHHMLLCEENYHMDTILSIVRPDAQPNLDYFNQKRSWQDFAGRTPEEYERWQEGVNREVAAFEVAQLIRLAAGHDKIIVDTHIPCDQLKEIAAPGRVALLLSPPGMAAQYFFSRRNPERMLLLSEIMKSPDPEAALQNYLDCIARVNDQRHFDAYRNNGFFTLVREDPAADTRQETLAALEKHFGLDGER